MDGHGNQEPQCPDSPTGYHDFSIPDMVNGTDSPKPSSVCWYCGEARPGDDAWES